MLGRRDGEWWIEEEDTFQLGFSTAFWADREVALVTVLGQAKGQGPALSQEEPGGLDLTCCDGMSLSSPVPAFSFCAACPSPYLEGLVHLGCSGDLQHSLSLSFSLILLLPRGEHRVWKAFVH